MKISVYSVVKSQPQRHQVGTEGQRYEKSVEVTCEHAAKLRKLTEDLL